MVRLATRIDVSQRLIMHEHTGYPPLPNDFDGFSCGAHKDYGCLTWVPILYSLFRNREPWAFTMSFSFLYADPTPGALQVFLNQPSPVDGDSAIHGEHVDGGGRWINADPIPGCVVCNIGESKLHLIFPLKPVLLNGPLRLTVWEVWTNGLYKSTLHRVVHRGLNYRVSYVHTIMILFPSFLIFLSGSHSFLKRISMRWWSLSLRRDVSRMMIAQVTKSRSRSKCTSPSCTAISCSRSLLETTRLPARGDMARIKWA